MKHQKILFLVPYPIGEAPSQRFRFEQYYDLLTSQGFIYSVKSFYSLKAWKQLHQPGNYLQKIVAVLTSIVHRKLLLFTIPNYDVVFIHREVAHIGPPIFEFIIAKIFRKKIIYDFDDAIWLPNYSAHNAKFHKLKAYGKVKYICKWATKVSCGNTYLANWAKQYNRNVIINPTTIDTDHYHNTCLYHKKDNEVPVIGWTGTLTTIQYLEFLVPILQELEQKYTFKFVVISNEKPNWNLKSLEFIKWSKASEIEDLMTFDIGVMPLKEDVWAKGKCGFKALQYMSLGVPAIVSPVGVNINIVDDGVNGFIASTPEEWKNTLAQFLQHPEKVKEMAKAARKKIVENYSVKSNSALFLNLFR